MTILDQAENVGGIVSAARKRERWQQQMAKTSDPEKREALRDAIGTLEVRFPELEDVPPGGAEKFARERGHGTSSRSPSHEGRQRSSATKRAKTAPPASKPSPKPSPPAAGGGNPSPASTRDRSRRRKSRAGGRARHVAGVAGLPTPATAWQQTGIPSTVGSGTSLAMSMLGALVGLSLLYLVLTSSERRGTAGAALPQMLGAVTRFLQRFISTGDILGGSAAAAPGPSYNDLVLSGQVAGPPNLLGMLPELQPIPRSRRTPTTPNPNLAGEVRRLPKVLPQPRR